MERLDVIAGDYRTSLMSTTVRGVRLSDLPRAVVGIRDGQIAWMFPSEKLIEGGCYPARIFSTSVEWDAGAIPAASIFCAVSYFIAIVYV